jgi:t-SNARE complex subunit (syntaxin)
MQVKSAGDYIDDGNQDMVTAIEYQISIRKKQCCCFAVLLVVLGVIAIVIYFMTKKK